MFLLENYHTSGLKVEIVTKQGWLYKCNPKVEQQLVQNSAYALCNIWSVFLASGCDMKTDTNTKKEKKWVR